MKIIIQTDLATAISIDIGFKTHTHKSMYFLTIVKEYYHYNHDGDRRVTYAEMLFKFLKHPKHRKNKRTLIIHGTGKGHSYSFRN